MFTTSAPAFLYGLYVALSAAFLLTFNWCFLVSIGGILLLERKVKNLGYLVVCFVGMFYLTKYLFCFPLLTDNKTAGNGYFTTHSLTIISSPFSKSYAYTGIFTSFRSCDGKERKNIPCVVFFPLKKPLQSPPITDQKNVFLEGVMEQRDPFNYTFKAKYWNQNLSYGKTPYNRFIIKNRIYAYIQSLFPQPFCNAFLNSMITGEMQERTLALEFNRVGLQHILGVSGIQFILFLSLLRKLFNLFFLPRFTAVLLCISLSAYYFLLGDSPAIQRAWIAASVYLIGVYLNRRCSPLNALGVALIAQVILNPLIVLQLGFILSFVCTWSILQLYPALEQIGRKILPKRSFSEVVNFSFIDQLGYIGSSITRHCFSLNLAVHSCAIPIILCLFHKFPLLGLAYNLFVPLISSFCLVLALVGMLLALLVPPIGGLMCTMLGEFINFFLKVVSNPPAILDYSIRSNSFTMEFTTLLVTAMLLLVQLYLHRLKECTV